LKLKDNKEDIYNLSGVYQLQCADCPLRYVGQIGRTFKVRFKEHIRDIKTMDKAQSLPSISWTPHMNMVQ
jgi:hypothetical protein